MPRKRGLDTTDAEYIRKKRTIHNAREKRRVKSIADAFRILRVQVAALGYGDQRSQLSILAKTLEMVRDMVHTIGCLQAQLLIIREGRSWPAERLGKTTEADLDGIPKLRAWAPGSGSLSVNNMPDRPPEEEAQQLYGAFLGQQEEVAREPTELLAEDERQKRETGLTMAERQLLCELAMEAARTTEEEQRASLLSGATTSSHSANKEAPGGREPLGSVKYVQEKENQALGQHRQLIFKNNGPPIDLLPAFFPLSPPARLGTKVIPATLSPFPAGLADRGSSPSSSSSPPQSQPHYPATLYDGGGEKCLYIPAATVNSSTFSSSLLPLIHRYHDDEDDFSSCSSGSSWTGTEGLPSGPKAEQKQMEEERRRLEELVRNRSKETEHHEPIQDLLLC